MTFTGEGDGEGEDSLSFDAFVTALRFFGLLVFLASINTEKQIYSSQIVFLLSKE